MTYAKLMRARFFKLRRASDLGGLAAIATSYLGGLAITTTNLGGLVATTSNLGCLRAGYSFGSKGETTTIGRALGSYNNARFFRVLASFIGFGMLYDLKFRAKTNIKWIRINTLTNTKISINAL
ncbi:unnamed protein product [Sphenostylis stenocarpa]|uniref:Uncharacterized protein n=1 Tax=Sphenostylis stenocarpa TaxID=92480 RepID=A0AA86SBP9_9FABA|nr:unnamed protein product [Sphenostylis stenocarpa]